MPVMIIQFYNQHNKTWYLYSRWAKKVIATRTEAQGPFAKVPISKNDK